MGRRAGIECLLMVKLRLSIPEPLKENTSKGSNSGQYKSGEPTKELAEKRAGEILRSDPFQ